MKIDCAAVFKNMGNEQTEAVFPAGVLLQWNPATGQAYVSWWEIENNAPKMHVGFMPPGNFSFPCIMPGGQSQTGGYWCPTTDPRTWRVGSDLTNNNGIMSLIVDGDIKQAPLALPSNPALFFFPPPDRGMNETTALALKAYWDSLVP